MDLGERHQRNYLADHNESRALRSCDFFTTWELRVGTLSKQYKRRIEFTKLQSNKCRQRSKMWMERSTT